MQLTDGMLVQRCLNGDKEAFGFLVDRYKEAVFGLAYSKVGNIHDAQDIAQEAFLNAYKNLRQFRHPYKFHSWLYAITANCCKMFFRKRAKEREYTEYLEKLPKESLMDESLRKHREEEMRQSLMDAIASLPEDTRLAMTLYYIDELSGKEIAEFMGISYSNVRVKLHRGRKLLGKELSQMAERRVGTSKVGFGFTIDILESIKDLTPKPIPKPKSPFMRALPWGASLVAALILGILGGLEVNLSGSDSVIGNSIVQPNWIETELFIEKPGLAETTSVDKDGKFPISDLPQMANAGGEKREKRGSAGAGQLPTLEEIAHKMGYMFGDIRDIKFTVKLTGPGVTTRVDRYEYKFPDKSRIEIAGNVSVKNGDQYWYSRVGEEDLIRVHRKKPPYTQIDITLRGLFALPKAILSDDYDVRVEGTKIIDGKEMLMLRFDLKKSRGTPLFVYAEELITTDFMLFAKRSEKEFMRVGIDPKTYLPLYQEFNSAYIRYKRRITKTGKFGDVVLPVEDEALTPSGQVRSRNRIEDVQLNTGIGDDRFKIPAGPDVIIIDESYTGDRTNQALQEYEKRVKSEPNNVALRYMLVNGHRNKNPLIDPDALRRHTEKLLELTPDSISAHYEAGEAYLRLDEPKKALASLQKVALATPNRRWIHSLMGKAYEQLGLIDESIKEYKIELQRLIDTEAWWDVGNYYGDRWNYEERGISNKLALLCRAHNRLEQLIEEYQQQIENSPENICLQRLLGDAYYYLGDKQQATQAYRRMFELIEQKDAIEGSTTSFDRRFKELGLNKELANYYQRKFDSGYFDDYELQLLIGLYADLNETDRVVEIYKAMVQRRGGGTEERSSPIREIINAEELMALLEKYVEKHPQDGMIYKLLADLHLRQGDVDGAIKLYERASSLDPENAEAHAALGKLYAEKTNYNKAAQHYEKAASLHPDEPYYKAHLAYAYNRLGRHDEAIAIGQKLTQEYENDPVATLALGCVYFNAGKYENAIEEFKRVLQYEESYQTLVDELNKFLAIAYLKSGKPEAMNLTPWTLEDLLNDCAEEDDYDGMLRMAIVGVRNQQDAWKPIWVLEWLISPLFESGRLDELLDILKQELKNDPDNALIYKMLGYSYETMARGHGKGDSRPEKWLEAKAMFQKALDLTADGELKVGIYQHLGTVYRIQKQYDKAIAVYQEIIKLKPKDIDARQRLAHIYERTKQYEKAIPIYQRLIELDKGSADVYNKSIERCFNETSR